MKKEIKFALAMAALLGVSVNEMADAQSAFVDDYNKLKQEGRL